MVNSQATATTLPFKQTVYHTSDSTKLNGILNNGDTGCSNQRNHVSDSCTTADFISVIDKTASMSLLSHEKAEIAVLVPQLFQLKKFICSDDELKYTGKIAQFFFKALSIFETEREGWCAKAV